MRAKARDEIEGVNELKKDIRQKEAEEIEVDDEGKGSRP